jgi:uncharacterized protein YbjT (DUF2867 family)
MKVILFGASGMVGQGVLRECLADPGVERVLAVVRKGGQLAKSDKLEEVVLADLHDYAALAGKLGGLDACFFCLGVSAAGMSEADYRRVTYDLTLAAARALLAESPGATFIYVSGAGTDSSAQGRTMWARVKGATENALLGLGFARAVMFRPGIIVPGPGLRSKTPIYRVSYVALAPFFPLLRHTKGLATTTERVGRAMLRVARDGAPEPVLDNRAINALGA